MCVSPAPWHRGVVGSHPAAAPLSGEKGCGGDARAWLGTWGPSPWPPLRARGVSCWVRPSYRRCRGRGRARRPPAAGPGGAAPGPWAQRPVLLPAASGGGRGKGKKGKKGKKGGDTTPRPPPRGQLQPPACPERPQCMHSWDMGTKGGGLFPAGCPHRSTHGDFGVPPIPALPQRPHHQQGAGARLQHPAGLVGRIGGSPLVAPTPSFCSPLTWSRRKYPGVRRRGRMIMVRGGAAGSGPAAPPKPAASAAPLSAVISARCSPKRTQHSGGGHGGVSGGTRAGLGSGRAGC